MSKDKDLVFVLVENVYREFDRRPEIIKTLNKLFLVYRLSTLLEILKKIPLSA